MKVRYIGSFPPPYGGVTIKNKLLADTLSEHVKIIKAKEGMAGKLGQIKMILQALIPGQTLIVGISARGKKSLLVTKLLYHFNRKTMNRSLYFMMGGTESNRIAGNPKEIRLYSEYKRLYVETKSMAGSLKQVGMNNVSIYPNCRKRTDKIIPAFQMERRGRLKCLFFSIIMPEKGADVILDVAERLPYVDFQFYGEINAEYEDTFLYKVSELTNVKYGGVFKGTSEQVYEELALYDILLLPTRCPTEGIPGILVEAKISGLPCVVSDNCYNKELVEDGVEGLVLERCTMDCLRTTIDKLDRDRNLLRSLGIGSYHSAERYYIDNYIDRIVSELKKT